MGGKALKNCNLVRLHLAQFVDLRDFVIERLKLSFPGRRIEVLKAYSGKSDFGNLSIIMNNDGLTEDIAAFATKTFASQEIVQTGDRFSFEVLNFQVDLMLVPSANYQFFADYHSYNGLGRLIGMLAHSMGLTLTETGLLYKWKDGDYKHADLQIADTWQGALEVLGYDYERWSKGFTSLEDIFQFVASSPYYSTDMFEATYEWKDVPPENRLTIRLSMAKWVDSQPHVAPYKASVEEWLPVLFEKIPMMKERFDETARHYAAKRQAHEKYNGNLVQALTGLTHRDLGNLLKKITASFGGVDQQTAWVIGASDAEIKAKVMEIHQAA